MRALLIGYARCSSDQRDLTLQRDGLAALGVAANRVYVTAPRSGPLALPCGSRWAKSGIDKVRDSVTMKRQDTRRSVLTAASRHAAVSGTPGRPPGQDTRLPKVWAGLSAGAALLAIAGSAVGLLATGPIYSHETSAFRDAAAAQDLVNLVLVGPLLLALTVRAYRGSLRSWLCWLGCLSFTVYNYAIYAFSIHFGALFLVWIGVLGLSLFALIGGLTSLDPSALKARFAARPVRLPGWFLIVVAVLFALLWLSEIVPDLLAGRPSTSATVWEVPTNPVHVLDLAFFLPAVCLSGVLLLRHQWLGYGTVVGQLVWLELTCLPILVTPFFANLRGDNPGWSVMAPIGIMALATLTVLWRLLRLTPGHPAEN